MSEGSKSGVRRALLRCAVSLPGAGVFALGCLHGTGRPLFGRAACVLVEALLGAGRCSQVAAQRCLAIELLLLGALGVLLGRRLAGHVMMCFLGGATAFHLARTAFRGSVVGCGCVAVGSDAVSLGTPVVAACVSAALACCLVATSVIGRSTARALAWTGCFLIAGPIGLFTCGLVGRASQDEPLVVYELRIETRFAGAATSTRVVMPSGEATDFAFMDLAESSHALARAMEWGPLGVVVANDGVVWRVEVFERDHRFPGIVLPYVLVRERGVVRVTLHESSNR